MHAEKTLQGCRFCKSSRIKFILERDNALIFKCRDCDIVFLGNQLDEESVKELYKYYSPTGFSNHLSPVTKIRYEKLLDGFEKYRKNNRLIDIGCGAGWFMLSASKRGWQADGTEISDEAIALAVKKGQRVMRGGMASLDLEKDGYDVATLFEIMEHTEYPEGILKKLSYALRPGGLVYITTPNYKSITRKLLGNRWGVFHKEHIFYFTPKILQSILKRQGFKIKKMGTRNLSLVEISRFFKKFGSFSFNESYKRQEQVRDLTEKKFSFSIAKKLANFALNAFKAGETIYVLAEK